MDGWDGMDGGGGFWRARSGPRAEANAERETRGERSGPGRGNPGYSSLVLGFMTRPRCATDTACHRVFAEAMQAITRAEGARRGFRGAIAARQGIAIKIAGTVALTDA